MGEKMSFERLRDWHRRVNKEWNTATMREQMQLVVEFPHGLAAIFLDAHLTQPAQAVDVGAKVADAWRDAAAACLGKHSRLFRYVCEEADKLTAALPNANGKEGS